jgi:hypothetical protein
VQVEVEVAQPAVVGAEEAVVASLAPHRIRWESPEISAAVEEEA